MFTWQQRARLFTLASALPRSRRLQAAARFYLDVAGGENFADPQINGEVRLLREVLTDARVVFDVGAATGTWTGPALAFAPPNAQFHCFEPVSARFAELSAHAWPERVRRVPMGLGATEGSRTLRAASGSVYDPRGGELVEGTFTTLDAYCSANGIANIDFLKLDVEGMEFDVLRGAERMLDEGRIARIQFEYSAFTANARVQLRDFFERLQPLGYSISRILPLRLEPCPTFDVAWENYRYKNFVAVL